VRPQELCLLRENRAGRTSGRRELDGVAFVCGGGLLALLRDVLRRADRACRLEDVTRAPDGTLQTAVDGCTGL
jgi:hypothetical protein